MTSLGNISRGWLSCAVDVAVHTVVPLSRRATAIKHRATASSPSSAGLPHRRISGQHRPTPQRWPLGWPQLACSLLTAMLREQGDGVRTEITKWTRKHLHMQTHTLTRSRAHAAATRFEAMRSNGLAPMMSCLLWTRPQPQPRTPLTRIWPPPP